MLRLVFSRIKGFLLLLALLCAAGVVMFDALPVLMYPQTRRPMVTVRFSHPGMSAIDFRDQYAADSIEPALTSMDNVDLVETTYSSDSSSITITFDWEIDGDAARDQVVAAMNGVRSYLPEDLRDAYSIRFREGENAGFIVMGVVSNATPPEELMPMLQAGVESRLATIDGVDEYGIYGLEELSVEVTLDHEAMLAAGVSMLDVDAAFRAGLSPSPLGTLREGDERYSLRLRRPTAGLESLGRLEIARDGLAVTRLEDIAEIDVRYDLP
ncbi:MAG TPA: efflux RND transporter permease subunit, partial [Spirochaetales bacterium]|nr:efflux RND transporter permease subunit [Spirochaetales bacterium]